MSKQRYPHPYPSFIKNKSRRTWSPGQPRKQWPARHRPEVRARIRQTMLLKELRHKPPETL